KTFNSIINSTNGILKGEKWKQKVVRDDMLALKQIALVNIKKIPGGSRAIDTKIKEFYNKYNCIIHKQIIGYEPNVIICGGTWHILDDFFGEYFGNECEKIKINEFNTTLYKYKKQILIYTYHPQNTKITRETYCRAIVDSVIEWNKNYRTK